MGAKNSNNSRRNGETDTQNGYNAESEFFALAPLARYSPYAVCRFLVSLSLVPLLLFGCVLLARLVERHQHHVHGLIQCGLSRLRQRMGRLRYHVALAVEALHHHV